MPIIKPKFVLGTNRPTGPHIATITDDSGELLPIIPGMAFFIIEEPGNAQKTLPFVLVSVSRNKIVLRLQTSEGGIQDFPFKCDTKVLMNAAAKKAYKKSQN